MQTIYLPLSDQWMCEHGGIVEIQYNQAEAMTRVLSRLQMSAAPHPVAENSSGDERGAGGLAGGHVGMTHFTAANLLLDVLNLLAIKVHDDEQAREVKDVLFNSDEGELALTTFEQVIGLILIEKETE